MPEMTFANDNATFKVLSLGRLVEIEPRHKGPSPLTLEVVEERANESQRPSYYTNTEEMLADPAGRKRLLEEALQQIVAWRKRFGCLTELESIAREVDRVTESPVVG